MYTKWLQGLTFCWQASWQIRYRVTMERGSWILNGLTAAFLVFAHRVGPSVLLSPSKVSVIFGRLLLWVPLWVFSKGLSLNGILLWFSPPVALCLRWGPNSGSQIQLDVFHWHTSRVRSQSQASTTNMLIIPLLFLRLVFHLQDVQCYHWGRGGFIRTADEGLTGPVSTRAKQVASALNEMSVCADFLVLFCFFFLQCRR